MRCARSAPRSTCSPAPGALARSWHGSRGASLLTRPSRPRLCCAATRYRDRARLGAAACAALAGPNAGLFEAAVSGRDRIHVVGGAQPLARLVRAGWRLRLGELAPEAPSLARFQAGGAVEEAEDGRDPSGASWRRRSPLRPRVASLVADLRRRAAAHPGMAERVLSTANKAKGLEWARVRLGADFPGFDELHAADQDGVPHLMPEERDQELNLLYVAATRTMRQLEPNDAVRGCPPHERDRSRCTARIGSCRRRSSPHNCASSQPPWAAARCRSSVQLMLRRGWNGS